VANACYSRVDNQRGIRVASVHRYNPEQKAPLAEEGTSGVSSGPSVEESVFARNWASSIRKDTLG
jgi:sulfide dehydrogenase [flavocytochrome c] flavoprotein chain